MQKGDVVRHFSNPECRATVVTVAPVRDCGAYGMGNWLRGVFMGQPVVIVRFPASADDAQPSFQESFAFEWEKIEPIGVCCLCGETAENAEPAYVRRPDGLFCLEHAEWDKALDQLVAEVGEETAFYPEASALFSNRE